MIKSKSKSSVLSIVYDKKKEIDKPHTKFMTKAPVSAAQKFY